MDKEVEIGEAAVSAEAGSWNMGKLALFMGIMTLVVLVDYSTKRLIQDNFHLYQQVEVIGEYLRLTFIYNPA